MEILDKYSFPFKPWPFLASMASQDNKILRLITSCLKNTVMLSLVSMWGVLCSSLEGN